MELCSEALAVYHAYNDHSKSFCELPFSVQKMIAYQSMIHGMYYCNKESFDAEYVTTDVKHKLFNMLHKGYALS